jgi:hypothetical protein
MTGMMPRRGYEMPPNQYPMLQQMNLHQPASLDLNNALLMNPSTPSCQMMYPPNQLPPVMNLPDLPAGMPLPPPVRFFVTFSKIKNIFFKIQFRHPRPMYPPVYIKPTIPPSPHI